METGGNVTAVMFFFVSFILLKFLFQTQCHLNDVQVQLEQNLRLKLQGASQHRTTKQEDIYQLIPLRHDF